MCKFVVEFSEFNQRQRYFDKFPFLDITKDDVEMLPMESVRLRRGTDLQLCFTICLILIQ